MSRAKAFQKPLLRWYHANKREMPWRKTRDPYRILISEVMLQQTQVQTVIPYYQRWIKRFPTARALAQASLHDVLKLWEGLGYYSRARNLHALAHIVTHQHRGHIPSTFEELKALPGIGRYTAGAVLSIAYKKKFPVLDGNVMRVFTRYFGIQKNISEPAVQRELWTLAESLVPEQATGDYNQALMELGATLCTPRNPDCPRCPLKNSCIARSKGLQSQLPIKEKARQTPHYDIGAAVIRRDDNILISQRPLQGLLGGLWEFPGGKQEPGEKLTDTVRREIKEELGVEIAVGKKLIAVDHAYSHFRITLHVFDCRYVKGKVQKLAVADWRWVKAEELPRFAFPAANQPIIRLLLDRAGNVPAGAV